MGKIAVAYNRQLGLAVFHALAAGNTYSEIEKMAGMPDLDTMLGWFDAEPDFQHLVLLARADQAQSLAGEIRSIADKADVTSIAAVEKARLQCEVRMWQAGQLWPSKYGQAK